MMQLHLTQQGYELTKKHGFAPHLQSINNPDIPASGTPWIWHGRNRTIFGRTIWLFVEAESQFCLCFFDMQPRELKQLDLTLWQRFVSEYAFMSKSQDQEFGLHLADEFLSVVRNQMTPLDISVQASELTDRRADYIFSEIENFLKRPRPLALSTQDEMAFTWRINTDLRPEKNGSYIEYQANKETFDTIFDLIQPIILEVALLSDEKIISHLFPEVYEISTLDFIHQHLKTNVLKYVSPVVLLSCRISLMLPSKIKIKKHHGQVLQFQPRA